MLLWLPKKKNKKKGQTLILQMKQAISIRKAICFCIITFLESLILLSTMAKGKKEGESI